MFLINWAQGGRGRSVTYSAALLIALAGSAAAGDSKLEPTAHSNVKRMYTPSSAGAATTAPSGAGGLKIFLDEHGRPTQDPRHINRRDALQLPEANTSHEGLTTEAVTLDSGETVIKLDLKGRFQTYSVGAIGADGKLRTTCVAPGDALDNKTSTCQEKCCK